jgi:uncharacterized protein YdhG (YjbR/CyaY superfamily)
MNPSSPPATIGAYIRATDREAKPILREIRRIIEETVPDATPTISYRMPAFRTDRVFIYFAAFKNHIGIFPPVRGDARLEKALQRYRGEKGNLKFPLDEPMPYPLIRRVVKALSKPGRRRAPRAKRA